ncbi:hypothetical protein LEP1GSC040_3944 [Leptospira santarosai str. 2000030832]|nr:hypothetical protein LEP1GSC040_3944 [Leptospira santarosai str. 2000030832]
MLIEIDMVMLIRIDMSIALYSILTDELRKLSSEDKNLLRSAILEFGFRKL